MSAIEMEVSYAARRREDRGASMAKGIVVGIVGMADYRGLANSRRIARDGNDFVFKRSHDCEFEAVQRDACE